MGEGQPRLLDQVRDRIRRKHYSIKAEQAYVDRLPHRVLRDSDAVLRVPLLSSRALRSLKCLSTALKRARDVLMHSPGLPNPV
jgi:hypothetical protein